MYVSSIYCYAMLRNRQMLQSGIPLKFVICCFFQVFAEPSPMPISQFNTLTGQILLVSDRDVIY